MDAAPKSGAYPMADRANIFGTLYVTFYDKWNSGGGRDACWPTFEAILGIAFSKADEQFHQAYERISRSDGNPKNNLSLIEMSAVVRECCALMDRIKTFDHAQPTNVWDTPRAAVE